MIKYDQDTEYIKSCFELAQKGEGFVSPNPMVGAVIVKEGRIIAQGYHKNFGGDHAEIDAIKNCTESTEGATLYVNLEPCCHTNKKTPPCLPAVINCKFSRVVISNLDPNPEVAGKSIVKLREAGIDVELGVLNNEGEKLNRVFFKFQREKRPFTHLKYAQSINGFISNSSGGRYLSNDLILNYVHSLRAKYDAILVGRKTIASDNPRLNVRFGHQCNEMNKYIIVIGNPNKLTGNELIFSSIQKKIIITTEREFELDFLNTEIITLPVVNIAEINNVLFQKNISSVLVEGGASIIKLYLDSKGFDEFSINISPTFVAEGAKIDKLSSSLELNSRVTAYGTQALFQGVI